MNEARIGKTAEVLYRGGVMGSDVIEGSLDGEPHRIELGAGLVARGLERVLFDMEVGETRTVVIDPIDGFGDYDSAGVRVMARANLPHGEDLEVGSVMTWRNPVSNVPVPVRVVEATDDYVKVDHNHPFAGKTLEYEVKLVGLE